MIEINKEIFEERPFKFGNKYLFNNAVPFNILERYMKWNPETMIEFGSYDGGEAIAFMQRYDNLKVYSIEANPELYKNIKKLEPFGVNIYNYVISDKNDIVHFYPTQYNEDSKYYKKNDYSGSGSILQSTEYMKNVVIHQDYLEPISIESITIENFCKKNNIINIDIMHIDVEGIGKKVIKGFGDIRPRVISIEIDAVVPYFNGASNFEEINKLLESMHYKCVIRTNTDSLFLLEDLI